MFQQIREQELLVQWCLQKVTIHFLFLFFLFKSQTYATCLCIEIWSENVTKIQFIILLAPTPKSIAVLRNTSPSTKRTLMDTSSLQSSMPVIDLKSGSQKMPVLGFGTASDPPVDSETTKNAVLQAIELGYRHFDTAAFYNSEQPLGEAIAEALNRGLIKSRDEVFITSKLWCSDAHAQFVLPALQKTLK